MSAEVLILLVVFVGLLLLNVPIAICIGLATVATIATLGDVPTGYVVAQRLATGIASFPLLAIPFFVLSGVLMGEGGMARRLMDFASSLVGRFPGGLAYVNTVTCMLFGAVSGSAAAAVSSIGGFMIPQMEAKGYKREFAVALTATSATTGLLIPPSNIMIVFAVVSGNVSVAALFLAGVLPGILVGLSIMAASFVTLRFLRPAHTAGKAAAASMTEMVTVPVGRAFLGALPSLLLVVIVLGGILGGLFSATEASAIAVAYCLILAMVAYREVKLTALPPILLKAALTTSVVMLLVGASQAMSWVLAYERVPQMVSTAMIALSDNPLIILLLINVLLLAVGVFMDMTPAVLIFTPIFLPVVTGLGMDPVHFGILMIANLCIGLCTPPVGTCLFVGCSVGKTTIARVVPSAIPFFIAMTLALLAITYLPWLSLALPRLFKLL
ncbi:MAG: TRAP transporter large permease [Candidatus Didemnitutus sp.]|nr:TRAP transporter large permease [Candidatus Didemnitutus sp.]